MAATERFLGVLAMGAVLGVVIGAASEWAEIFCVGIYCIITTARWSCGGSAVVCVHPPAASMEIGEGFSE